MILQTPLIIDGLRRCSRSESAQTLKPGRELVTFLIACNISLWVMETFEIKSNATNSDRIQFYGKIKAYDSHHRTISLLISALNRSLTVDCAESFVSAVDFVLSIPFGQLLGRHLDFGLRTADINKNDDDDVKGRWHHHQQTAVRKCEHHLISFLSFSSFIFFFLGLCRAATVNDLTRRLSLSPISSTFSFEEEEEEGGGGGWRCRRRL